MKFPIFLKSSLLFNSFYCLLFINKTLRLNNLKIGTVTVPHPDAFWYRLNGMGAQKVLVTLFPNIFHVKTK